MVRLRCDLSRSCGVRAAEMPHSSHACSLELFLSPAYFWQQELEMLSWDSGVQQPGALGFIRLHLECSGAFLSPPGQLPEAPAASPSPE